MFFTSWLTALLRERKRNTNKKAATRKRFHDRTGWQQIDLLEDRTMLSAVAPRDLPVSAHSEAPVESSSETDLTITKTSNQVAVTQGAELTYTITVNNAGPTAVTDALVEDETSHFLTDVNWTATPTGGASATTSGTGDLAETIELPVGASVVYTITGTVNKDVQNIVTNVATVSSALIPDSDLSNNSAHDSDVVVLDSYWSTGTFSDSGQALPLTKEGYNHVVLGDIDSDGDMDAIVAPYERHWSSPLSYNQFFIWTNDGKGVFTSGGEYESGEEIIDIQLDDLDGDNDLDILLVTRNEADQIWLNDGAGQFTKDPQIFGEVRATGSALGDIDGDGDLDILIATGGSGTEIWKNDGTGTFTVVPTPFGTSHYKIGLGDIDADGDLDAFIGGGSRTSTTVWLNNGSGNFSDSGQELANGYPSNITLGDVDGDGDLDAFKSVYTDSDDEEQNRSIVFLNDGTGVFSVGQEIDTYSIETHSMEDFDGDGDLDLIFAQDDQTKGSTWVNDGQGVFIEQIEEFPFAYVSTLATGDLNNDGTLDVFAVTSNVEGYNGTVWFNGVALPPPAPQDLHITKTANQVAAQQGSNITYTVTVSNNGSVLFPNALVQDDYSEFLNNVSWTAVTTGGATGALSGSGNIFEYVALPVDSTITYTITGKVKADAHQIITNVATVSSDLVAGSDFTFNSAHDSDIVVLATTNGAAEFYSSGQEFPSHFTRDIALGDLDGDGDLDVIQSGDGDNNTHLDKNLTLVWLNNGEGVFEHVFSIPKEGGHIDVQIGDLDGDGDLDLFIASRRSPDEIWFNHGDGTFFKSDHVYSKYTNWSSDIGDLDGDGDLDIVVTNGRSSSEVWLNDGTGHLFQLDYGFRSGESEGTDITLGDFDNDGDLDAFMTDGTSTYADKVWFNDGTGHFVDSGQRLGINRSGYYYSASIQVGDLDGDGDLDVVTGDEETYDSETGDFIAESGSLVWLNDGTGQFTVGQEIPAEEITGIALGDLDSDGDLDLVTTEYDDSPNQIWLNDGTGQFETNGFNLPVEYARLPTLGDLNSDGTLDLFVFNYNAPDAHQLVWFNKPTTDLEITKTSNQVAVTQGAEVTYTVAVSNVGFHPVTDALVEDQYSDFLTNVSWTATAAGGAIAATSGTGNIEETVELPAGAEVIYTITGTVQDDVRNIITNVATVSSELMIDSNYSNNSAHDSDVVVLASYWSTGEFADSGQELETLHGYFHNIVLGDIDSDGDLDAIVSRNAIDAAPSPVHPADIWLNNGLGAFSAGNQLETNAENTDLQLADLDGDNDLDLLIINYEEMNQVWKNDGTGNFTKEDQEFSEGRSLGSAIGDIDGDGDIDLLVTKNGNQGTEKWINDGTGFFTLSPNHIDVSGYFLELGDLDGDGDLDAFYATTQSDSNAVWFNDGSGNFLADEPFFYDRQVFRVSLGDVDGDGDLDVLGGVGGDDGPMAEGEGGLIWLNNGEGIFSVGQVIDNGAIWDQELADFDGDGDLDIVFAEFTGEESSVWLNNGQGVFTEHAETLPFSYITALETGDLNGDATLDIFSVKYTPESSTATIWFNPVAPPPEPQPDILISKTSNQVAAVQGSTINYIVTVSNNGDVLFPNVLVQDDYSEFLNNVTWTAVVSGGATGSLSGTDEIHEYVELPVGSSIIYTITGKVNHNVRNIITNVATVSSELVAGSDFTFNSAHDSDLIVLSAAAGTGNFIDSGQQLGDNSNDTTEIVLGDLDGDGDLDAFVTHYEATLPIEIWLNSGTGVFTLENGYSSTEGRIRDVSLADLDGDGDLDAVISGREMTQIWINNGLGQFAQRPQNLTDYRTGYNIVGDLDGDGDLDIVLEADRNGTEIWFNDGFGNFVLGRGFIYSYRDAALGDVDGDGDLDLFFAETPNHEIWLNDGSGEFTSSGQALNNSQGDTVVLGDVDGDGDLDAVVGSYYDRGELNESVIWINNGAGQFTQGEKLNTNFLTEIALGDLDADGDLDIFTTQEYEQPNVIWLNDGNGNFESHGPFFAAEETKHVSLGDLDDDGDLDAFIGNWGAPNRILLNEKVAFPFRKDFENGNLIGLDINDPDKVTLIEQNGSKKLQIDNSGLTGLTTARFDWEEPLPTQFEMSVELTSIGGPDRWHDGFLIFDYVHSSDFKYAGMYAGQNQWVIGHFQEHSGDRFVEIDWDDSNRIVDVNVPYTLHLHINENYVQLSVDGELVLSTTLTEPLNDGQVGFASVHAVTAFDNFEVAEHVEAGAPVTFPLLELFDDGKANGFVPNDSDAWTVTPQGKFQANGLSGDSLKISTVGFNTPFPSAFEISTELTSIGGPNRWHDGFIIFDYKSETDFKYAGTFVGQNQWVIGHYQGHWGNRSAQVDWDDSGRSVNANQAYTLHVRIDGGTVQLSVDGELITTAEFDGEVNGGQVGLAAYNAVTEFDHFELAEQVDAGAPPYLPYLEDFDDNKAEHFIPNNTEAWFAEGATYVVDTSNNGGLGTSTLTLARPLPSAFEISTELTSIGGPNRWHDGFIIFDYKSETDFKYAGTFVGQNQWVIGHYQGHWGDRLAQVDWDDSGRSINVNQAYTLHVRIDGNHVELSVDGEFITSANFGSAVNRGKVGLAAHNAVTHFDNFQVKEESIAASPIDTIFAEHNSSPLFV